MRKIKILVRILLIDLTHMMSMVNLMAIGVLTLKIDSRCFIEIEV